MSYFTEKSAESTREIYSPSSFAKENLLYLQEVGQLKAVKKHISNRSSLDSFLFFIVTEGNGHLRYGRKTYALIPGDCVFINCRLGYTHETSMKLWGLKWVHFNGRGMTHIYEKYEERGGSPTFHMDNPGRVHSLISSIHNLAKQDDFLRDIRLNEALSNLLTVLMENSWNPENQALKGKKNDFSVASVKEYLDENWNKKICLDDIAGKFAFNKYTLLRSFKKAFGMSILEYQILQKIAKSKEQLRFSSKAVSEIAADCGFGDANYFSREFKKMEGTSPTQFRDQWAS